MKNTKSTKLVSKVLTLEDATAELGGKSSLANAVGKHNQHYSRWIGKKLVVKSNDEYCLVEDNAFWRARL